VRIDVALLPALLDRVAGSVCVVVDALRATSTIVTLLARGAEEVAVAATVEEARALRAGPMRDRLLCGEVGGLPPEGFDYGNSPAEFSGLDLRGRRVLLATSNGTRALIRAAEAPVVFAGSLLNAGATARAATAAARRQGLDIVFLCAGTELGRAFSLEDAGVCGALVEAVVRDGLGLGGREEARLTDGAAAAYRVWRSYPGARLLFGEASHGQALARLGLAADLDFCARRDLYDVVPRLVPAAEGAPALRPD
jgi:2-phosphosulfolactate phosphatase